MAKWEAFCVLACALFATVSSPAFGQVDDEYRRKMDELNRRAATRPATTKPTTRPAPKVQSAASTETVQVVLFVAKPTAPDWIKPLLESYREQGIRSTFWYMIRAERTYLSKLDDLEKVRKRPLKRKSSGIGPNGQRVTQEDPADEAKKLQEIREAREDLRVAGEKVKEWRQAVRAVQAGEITPSFLPLSMQVGQFGEMEVVRVDQVLGDNRMRIRYGQKPAILNGISTAGAIDGSALNLAGHLFRVTGTETYTTVLGGTNTVFSVEPVDLKAHVDGELVTMTRDELERELEEMFGQKIPKRDDPMPVPSKEDREDSSRSRGRPTR